MDNSVPGRDGVEINFHVNQHLCDCCHNLVRDILNHNFHHKWQRVQSPRKSRSALVKYGFQHQPRQYFLQRTQQSSSSSSCPLCDVLLESMWNRHTPHCLSLIQNGPTDPWEHMWIYVEVTVRENVPSRDFVLFSHPGQIQDWKAQDYLLESASLNIFRAPGPGLSPTTGDYIFPQLPFGAPFAQIRTWIDNCTNRINGHGNCHRGKSALPTRVIDVHSHPPRLVLSYGKSAQYVALSHCWGGLIKTRLLHETKDKFLNQGITETTLPETFKDAIMVTRKLGFRWLWIDALCIIQDDEDDWTREALRMCEVYEQAVLVLSAYSTPGSQTGIRFRRAARVATFEGNDHAYIQNDMWRQYDTKEPLGGRGWTLQEHALAFAILYMGRGLIEWICPAGVYVEDRPEELVEADGRSLLNLNTEGYGSQVSDQQSAWRHVVQHYTARKLTFQGDKMVALAGVAQKFEKGLPLFQTPDTCSATYVAGLWKENIVKDLLWASKADHPTVLHRYRAPSWTWAAWDAPVTWDLLRPLESFSGSFKEYCTVSRINLSSSSKGAGNLLGRLDITGLLVPVSSQVLHRPIVGDSSPTNPSALVTDDRLFDEFLKSSLLGKMGERSRARRDLEGSMDRDTTAPCCAVRLCGAQTTSNYYSTVFMLVEEVSSAQGRFKHKLFRRVGILAVRSDVEEAQGKFPPVKIAEDPFGWPGKITTVTVI